MAPVPADQHAVTAWRIARLVLEAIARSANAVGDALDRAPPPRRVGVDLLIGGGAVAAETVNRVARLVATAGRSVAHAVPGAPAVLLWVRPHPEQALAQLVERGRRERTAAFTDVERLAEVLVPAIAAALHDRIDLTALVRERVDLDSLVGEVDLNAIADRLDLNAVASRIDVDTVAERLDLDAVIERIDLVALTERVLDGIDLPEIIRESTGSMTGELVRGVRMQSIEADQALAGLMSRLLRRGRRATPPGELRSAE
jgi:hypothetical protein